MMNRRSFLQLIGIAGAAATLPSTALTKFVAKSPEAAVPATLRFGVNDLMEVHSVSLEHNVYNIGSDETFAQYLYRANSGRVTVHGMRKPNFHKIYDHFDAYRPVDWTLTCTAMRHSAVWRFTAMVAEIEESSMGAVKVRLYFSGAPHLEVK